MCARGCTEQNIASCKRSGKRRRSAAAGASQPAGDAPSGQSAAVAKRSNARHGLGSEVVVLADWFTQEFGAESSVLRKKVHDLLFQRRKWQVPRDLWENKDQLETVTCLASETHTVESIKAVLEERRAWMQTQGLRVIGMERTSTQTMSAGRPPSESVTVTLMKSRKIVLTAVKQTWTAVEFAHDTLTRFCTFC